MASRVYSYPMIWAMGIYHIPTSLDGLLRFLCVDTARPASNEEQGSWNDSFSFWKLFNASESQQLKGTCGTDWSNTLAQNRVNQNKLLRAVYAHISIISTNGDSNTYYMLTGILGFSVAEKWGCDDIKLRFRFFKNPEQLRNEWKPVPCWLLQ